MTTTSLTRARDFARVQSTGRRGRSDGIAVAVVERDDSEATRVGLAVGRSAGGAVARNRIKRRLRAAWRAADVPPGCEVVVRGGPDVSSQPFQELVNHLETALTRAIGASRA